MHDDLSVEGEAVHVVAPDDGRFTRPDDCARCGVVPDGLHLARVVYDDAGNPLATNFAEYGIPSAAEFPSFDVRTTVTPTHMNPLGVKGIGESGTIGATPAVQNAVIDALAHLGVTHIDMPLTSERVWRSIVDATAQVSTPSKNNVTTWPTIASESN